MITENHTMKTKVTFPLYFIIVFLFSFGCEKERYPDDPTSNFKLLETGKYHGTFQYESGDTIGLVGLIVSDDSYYFSPSRLIILLAIR